MGQLLRLEKSNRKMTIAYDQNGNRSEEQAYVALDLGGIDPGDQVVEVAITDLLTGRQVFREAAFRMVA